MRTHRWLKALACGLCLGAAADSAVAQGPWDGGGEWVTADGAPAYAPDGGYPYAAAPPGMYQPPYATNDPGVLYPPQTPAGYSPWPHVSPYGMGNISRDTHYNQNGTWFREVLTRRREQYFSIDALYLIGKKPGNANIGAKTQPLDDVTNGLEGYTLPTYGWGGVPGSQQGTGGATTEPTDRVFIAPGVFPYPFLFEAGDIVPIAIVDNNLFPIHKFSLFGDFRSAGLQLNWGFEDETGLGVRTTGWWGFDDSNTFQRGSSQINGIPLTQDIIINQAGRMLFTRNGAVPWDTGIPISVIGGAEPGNDGGVIGTQKYDVMYRMNVTQEMGGGDIQLYLPDITYSNSAVRLRPAYSAKYLYIGEGFHFRGIDSGLSYTIDGEDGATENATFRPTGPPFTINNDLFETSVKTDAKTHLAGPTVGFRYDFGRSRGFKLWGQTSAGLMANHEEVRVRGFNAGETVITQFVTGTSMLDGDSSFSDTERHTHVSPLFETSINAESRVLAALPLIKEIPFVSDANLRLGYTYTLVGNVARPAHSTEWLGFPESPKVNINYKSWNLSRFNLGLEWTY
ncbi:MAG: hypothetical protein KF774_18730 [Planctomyces sp.]|nr:hypothetical protein [Planctomyces sp.]